MNWLLQDSDYVSLLLSWLLLMTDIFLKGRGYGYYSFNQVWTLIAYPHKAGIESHTGELEQGGTILPPYSVYSRIIVSADRGFSRDYRNNLL